MLEEVAGSELLLANAGTSRLTRYRQKLVEDRSKGAQRIQKL